MTGADTREGAMVKFLMNPEQYRTWTRTMPNLGITRGGGPSCRPLFEVRSPLGDALWSEEGYIGVVGSAAVQRCRTG